MLTFNISKGDLRGKVTYEPQGKQVNVEFPDENVAVEIIKFLSGKREFWIPESQRIDDFRIDLELPTENEQYFTMAMSSLLSIDVILDGMEET